MALSEHYAPLTMVFYSLNVLLDLLGTCLFGIVLFISLRSKNLQGTCHRLIGLSALYNFLTKPAILLPFVLTAFPSLGPLPMFVCGIVYLLPATTAHNAFALMSAIGMDRMLCIFFPIWYKTRNNKSYLAALLLLPMAYAIFTIFLDFEPVLANPNQPSNCAGFLGQNGTILRCNLAFMALTLACYALLSVKIVMTRGEGTTSIRQAIYKSLALIVAIQIGGWIVALIGYTLFIPNEPNLERRLFLYYSLNCFTSLISSAEVPVLYITSSEHFGAFKREFGWIWRFFSKSSHTTIYVSNTPPLAHQHRVKPVDMAQNSSMTRKN